MHNNIDKVFYKSLLQWLASNNESYSFGRIETPDIGEIAFKWQSGEENVLIKFNIVGAITQIVHSGKWFANTCSKSIKSHGRSFFAMIRTVRIKTSVNFMRMIGNCSGMN